MTSMVAAILLQRNIFLTDFLYIDFYSALLVTFFTMLLFFKKMAAEAAIVSNTTKQPHRKGFHGDGSSAIGVFCSCEGRSKVKRPKGAMESRSYDLAR